MDKQSIDRRELLKASAIVAGATVAAPLAVQAAAGSDADNESAARFRYCFNTSTIRGQNLEVTEQINVAAKAGYDSMELWLGDLHKYASGGGSLDDLRKQLVDAGLTVESASRISFFYYFGLLVAALSVAWAIHWMANTYGGKQSFSRALALASMTATPLFLVGFALLTPELWLNLVLGLPALAYVGIALLTDVISDGAAFLWLALIGVVY